MPREHGAWGMLLVPFATAVAISGVFDAKVALLLASTLSFYIARASWLRRRWKWTALLLAGSLVTAAPLFLAWRLWWLAAFAGIAAALAVQPTRRGLAMQLAAVAGLTLTAPSAWYAATGRLDATAFWLWLWNALYFVGGLLYVRMRVEAAARRVPLESLAARMRFGAPVLGFFCVLTLFLLALVAGGVVSCRTLSAFVPAVARAAFGVGRLAPQLSIKRLGWTEVAHSILFGALLTMAMR